MLKKVPGHKLLLLSHLAKKGSTEFQTEHLAEAISVILMGACIVVKSLIKSNNNNILLYIFGILFCIYLAPISSL